MLTQALLRESSLGHVGDAHVVRREQFDHEPGLLENAERLLLGDAHQAGDARGFFLAQRDIRHALDAEFGGAAITFEAVQQQTSLRRVDSGQRLFDTPLGDRRQQARFGSVVPQSVTLIAEIQARSFHGFAHRTASRRVLVQITQNIFAARRAADAALSHTFSQRGEEFLAADRSAFEQARDHPHIRQDA